MYTELAFHCLLFSLINATLQTLTLDEILKGTFNDQKWNGTWISDKEFWFQDLERNVCLFDVTKSSSDIFLSAEVFSNYSDYKLVFCNNMNYVLLKYNHEVSTTQRLAQYTMYDIFNKHYHQLHNHERIQRADCAPVGSSLVYVFENNIYYVQDIGKISAPRKITSDGISGVIYNGVTNFIYKSETICFSPNGDKLMFAYFDDTDVADFHYVMYGESYDQYSTVKTTKYPKVGTANPKVLIKYVDLNEPRSEVVTIKDIINVHSLTHDYIYQDAFWVNNDEVVGVFLNRVQNVTSAVRCNIVAEICLPVYTVSAINGWITMSSPLFNRDTSIFLILAPEEECNDTYNHLSMVHNGEFYERKRLTYGKREVLSIYKWDEARNIMWYVLIMYLKLSKYLLNRYYSGTDQEHYGNQHVFQFDLITNTDSCLTCGLSTPEGFCKFATAEFSYLSSYVAIVCNGPGPALVQIHNLENLNNHELESNSKLRRDLLQKVLPIKKNIEIHLSNFKVHVRLLLPPELDEDASQKYPMIVNVYGGPGSNLIQDEYILGLETYFVTHCKYVYAFIDGRGSGRNGNNFMFQVYRQLGTVEVEDQIEAVKFLHKKYGFIDATNTGIWGGSYGGFLTLLTLAIDKNNVFKWGLAVAPVTNFVHYSSIYTEKYMGFNTNEYNFNGYVNTNISNFAQSFQNKIFCIIHGNADSNVHYQHSMLLIKELQKKGIIFCQQSYPDENHNFENTLTHLYHTIINFVEYGFKHEKIIN